MSENMVLTRKGYEELEQKLEYLKNVRRKEVAEQIKVARSYGDLSENAEYDEARNEQSLLEGQIQTIENQLKLAVVVEEDEMNFDKVSIGAQVKVLDMEFNEEDTYKILGTVEADPMNNIISNESPMGRALIGAGVGDVVEVEAPDGVIRFKVLEISKGEQAK
ncbi:MAG: transcription elongation factor GreA [Christensenellaceae bacterium]|nr:transcription elongation factor GreA [Christensenellaceae bacterium]